MFHYCFCFFAPFCTSVGSVYINIVHAHWFFPQPCPHCWRARRRHFHLRYSILLLCLSFPVDTFLDFPFYNYTNFCFLMWFNFFIRAINMVITVILNTLPSKSKIYVISISHSDACFAPSDWFSCLLTCWSIFWMLDMIDLVIANEVRVF